MNEISTRHQVSRSQVKYVNEYRLCLNELSRAVVILSRLNTTLHKTGTRNFYADEQTL